MTALKKKLVHFENRMDAGLERFVNRHRLLGYMIVFVGMPLFTLAMVSLGTFVIALPLGWLFGCL